MISKFKNAFRGLWVGFLDSSIRIQLVCMLLATIACLIIQVELLDFILVSIVCCLVISLEFVNTVIERIMDFVCPSFDERVKDIKDMSAAFVLIASFGALLVAAYIGIKYFL